MSDDPIKCQCPACLKWTAYPSSVLLSGKALPNYKCAHCGRLYCMPLQMAGTSGKVSVPKDSDQGRQIEAMIQHLNKLSEA